MTALIDLINRFFSYLAVGVINTLLCFLLMYLGHLWGMNYLYYTAFGYLFAIAFSFFMNLRFTFQVEGQLLKRLTLFVAIGLCNLLLVEYIEFTLIERFDSGTVFAIVCGMAWNVLAGFLACNFLVYRRQPEVNS